MSRRGFTIVELLIVIVVIAILAAITIVSYNGIQSRASDTVIQNDLRTIGNQIMQFAQTSNTESVPVTSGELATIPLKAASGSYGAHYFPSGSPTNGYNLAYCAQSGTNFAIIAGSKSGKIFVFRDGTVKEGGFALRTINGTCSDYGVPSPTYANWFYNNNAWLYFVSV